MGKVLNLRETARLHVGGDERSLDGYLFRDHTHAAEWLKQGFVAKNPDAYTVSVVEVATSLHNCGNCTKEDIQKVLHRKLTVQEYLSAYSSS
jgi:hypothetical protein